MTRAALVLGWVGASVVSGCTSLADMDEWPRNGGTGGGASSATASATGSGGGAGSGGKPACTPSSPADGYAMTVLEDEPVGYWRLDETEATIAKDQVGCRDGTYHGSVETMRPGAVGVGTGAFFDGDAARIELGDVLDFAGTSVFSLEAWVKPVLSTSDGKFRRIIDKGTAASPREGYCLQIHELQLLLERWNGNESDSAELQDLSPYDDGDYLHIVGTYDKSMLSLYLDGVLVASVNAEQQIPDLGVALVFGSNQDDTNNFIGDLDEVAIYGHALSAERVVAHYAAGMLGR